MNTLERIVYSTFFKPIFWMAMGLLYATLIAAAPLWAAELGLAMNWWKWVLSALWYALLSYSVAGAATLLGEKEPAAWYRFLGFHLAVTLAAGAILIWLLMAL